MNNSQYWKNRIDYIFEKNYTPAKIKNIYKKSYNNIERDIYNLYDELKSKEELTTTELYQYNRFQALLESLKEQNKDIKGVLSEDVTNTLTKAYKQTFGESEILLGKKSPWGIQNRKMLKSVLKTKWAGSNYSKRIWVNTDKLSRRIESDIVMAVIQGTNKDVFIKVIQRDFNTGFNNADRLIRTELMHVINQGQIDTYKSEGIKKVRWLAAVNNNRTCSLCMRYNKKIFDINKCPIILHPRCRCTIIPVIDKTDKWLADDKKWEQWLKNRKTKYSGAKLIDKTGKSGIIKEKAYRKSITDNIPAMDVGKFNKIKSNLENMGIKIIQDKDGDDYLKAMGAEAMTLSDGTAIIFQSHRPPSASACFEEIIHTTQIKQKGILGFAGNTNDYIEYLNREIEANEKVLKYAKAYGLTEADKKSIRINLQKYYEELRGVK